ncbi:MAG: ATP-dependent helicase RecG [Frankiales bacterium]|nr:ATP-dependent helicase RecG [Frankiales bacterium]
MATMDTLLRDVLGGRTANSLDKGLALVTVADLLHHYPRRFAERGELTDLSQLVEGDEVTVQAEVSSAKSRRIPGRKLNLLEVVISAGGRQATLSFFNQPWREKELRPGRRGFFSGKVTRFRTKLQLNQPDYILLDDGDGDGENELRADDFAGALIPVYPAASGIPSWTVAKCVRLVLDQLDEVADPLPFELRARVGLLDVDRAIRQIHRPADRAERQQARNRLAFDEAFGVQLVLAQRRHANAANPAIARPPRAGGLVDAFGERLPFTFTGEQAVIADEIARELAAEHPMQRLLQGEVGSGKTVVALRAMLQVVDAGGQAALLAPTEVLATQHLATITELLGSLAHANQLGGAEQGTAVVLLTGSMSTAARRAALLDIASGAAGIVVGTHALLQDNVQFADLGLVVVDEQHRFGVEQRDALRGKAVAPPHLLVMTATPIPRTVAMTVFGDLETSELRELPSGRKEVKTQVVPAAEKPEWMDRVWSRIAEEVAQGYQVYVVCPRIGDGAGDDTDGLAGDGGAVDDETAGQTVSVLNTAAELAAGPLAHVRLGVMHGRLPAEEKTRVMQAFVDGDCQVLVATTVIEVGVNVANASMMVVLDADRFGVSQLHQLRGRIGRGELAGLCLLVSRLPIAHPSFVRLQEVSATRDGFELAMLDLRQRREGDVLGAAQSGRRSQLKLLSLLGDEELIRTARVEAQQVIDADPTLSAHPELSEFLWSSLDSERTEFLQKS